MVDINLVEQLIADRSRIDKTLRDLGVRTRVTDSGTYWSVNGEPDCAAIDAAMEEHIPKPAAAQQEV